MCGLIFNYCPDVPQDDARATLMAALQMLRHRGPDELRTEVQGAAQFGHTRLAIIDLGDSHQPMRTVDGRHTLVFNGEIYNYRELRQALASRWQFRTQGDTEVLLAGLVLDGEAFLPRLEGMWAFALWDARTSTALLSRDRMGKKPLYYFQKGQQFACASELPTLRRMAAGTWTEDVDSTGDYFRYGYCLPGYTLWKDVFEVLPGHWLRWTPPHAIEQQAYWRLPLPDPSARAACDEELVDMLESAVRKRLVADVEVGAFLSGGIDSSLVCAIAQSMMDRPLKTYTIGFSESAFDESRYAAEVAHYLGTDHRVETFSKWDQERLTALLQHHLGQAFADSSLLPTALVSEVAARDVKVALSGDGADELFGGYQRYQARLILRWYTRLPASLRRMAEQALRALPEPAVHHSRSLLKKAHLFVDVAQRQQAEMPYTAPLMFHPDEFAKLFPELVRRGHTPHGLDHETTLDELQQMMYGDALIYLPQDILTKVDRASMAHSLETRAPFLDHKVVEVAFSRPARQHLSVGKGKRWLRNAFEKRLPAQTWQRRKQGFGVPIHQWFRGELGVHMASMLEVKSGPVNANAAKRLLQEHRSGARDHGYRLWMIYVYITLHHR